MKPFVWASVLFVCGSALLAAGGCCRKAPPGTSDPPASGNVVVTDPATGKGVLTPLHLERYAPPPYGLENGRAAFKAKVASSAFMRGGDGDGLIAAPATGRRCVFWWLEVRYEDGEAGHDVYVGDAGVPVLVDVGESYVKADAGQCRHVGLPVSENVYDAATEPDTGGLVPAHLFPRTTWREWVLMAGETYAVTVETPPTGGGSIGEKYVFNFN